MSPIAQIEMYVDFLSKVATINILCLQEFGERINQMSYSCFSNTSQTIFLLVTFAFFAIIQIIGIVFTIQTRKVKIKLLNDSKYIAAVIYICSISLALIAIVTIVPGSFINISEVVFSGSVLTATTFLLGLIFVPKVMHFKLLLYLHYCFTHVSLPPLHVVIRLPCIL